jgi:hypothetical protein
VVIIGESGDGDVVPGDKAGGRFVSNIANIEVQDATTN